MSIVKINALDVVAGKEDEFFLKFSRRPHRIEAFDGFEGFQVLRPTDGRTTWLVVTTWRDEKSFDAWHGQRPPRDPATITYADSWELWSFDVLEQADPVIS